MLTVYRYSLEKITALLQKSADDTKKHIMLSSKPEEKITIEWDKDSGGVITYTVNEEVSIPFGKRNASFSFVIPEDKLITLVCIPTILKLNLIKQEDFGKYFFLSFKLIKK